MARPQESSPDLKDVMMRGATARQLGLMFGMATATIEARLGHVTPSGQRAGSAIYRVGDAAPFLVPPAQDQLERLLRTNHKNLPPLLMKEYWQGQAAQLKVKEEIGELWRTEAVIEYFGAAFRDIKQEINLMRDALARDTVLTDELSAALDDMIEGCLRGIQERLRHSFENRINDPLSRNAQSVLDHNPEPIEPTFEDLAAQL